jgi:putative methionine-R-sulfoxide reductase with GAF domain
MNSEFRIQRCNQAAQELVRHPVVGRCCWEVVHGAREPVPDCPFSKMCLSGCGESAELQLGSRWYNCTVDPIFDGHHRVSGAVHVLWDITGRKLVDTERKQTEQLLRKTNRRLQAVRECHAAMLRARTEKELLDAICRIIVRSGSGRMAWVGFAKMDARKSIQPVAQAGLSRDFIKQTRVTWADIPRGRGPTGTAIRTGKPCLCRDTFADPGYAPWRTAARRRGYGSLIALPLLAGQHCFGALVIHARQVDAFDVRDQLLFTDLANDLAFGINTLRLRAEHERLEKEIIKSSEREQAPKSAAPICRSSPPPAPPPSRVRRGPWKKSWTKPSSRPGMWPAASIPSGSPRPASLPRSANSPKTLMPRTARIASASSPRR